MDWNNTNVSKDDYYHLLSMVAIKNDAETIKALIPVISQPILALSILPYISLFCSAVEEYYDSCNVRIKLQNNSPFELSDVRNKLKLFSDRYTKSQTQILTTDAIQDSDFKGKLRFHLLGSLKCYFNLGVFFNADGQVIGNTQYMYYMFQDKKFSKGVLSGEELKCFGEALGTVVASVCAGLSNFLPEYDVHINPKRYPIFYQDYNTNKHFDFFPSHQNGKEASLRILHLLCSINFVRYILNEIIPAENIWSLRVKYVTVYYVYKSIERFQHQAPTASVQAVLNNNRNLMVSSFRGCMMHYGLMNKGVAVIKDEYLDLGRAFFGVIESCFDGIEYEEFCRKLDQAIIQFSDCLSNIVVLDASNIKPLA